MLKFNLPFNYMSQTLEVYSLQGCPYSIRAEKRLQKYSKVVKVISVPRDEKIKNKYKKMNKMSTFPQIYLVDGKKRVKIGGYSSIEKILDVYEKLEEDFEKNKKVQQELNETTICQELGKEKCKTYIKKIFQLLRS